MAKSPLPSRVLSRLLCKMECIYSEISVDYSQQSWWSHSVPLKINRLPAFQKHPHTTVKASPLLSQLPLPPPPLPHPNTNIKSLISVNTYPLVVPRSNLGTILDLLCHFTSKITSSLLLLST